MTTVRPALLDEALALLGDHAAAVIDRRRAAGKPTCADPVATLAKLTAVMEELGEVARALHDDEGDERLRSELLDTATAAMLWAWSIP